MQEVAVRSVSIQRVPPLAAELQRTEPVASCGAPPPGQKKNYRTE